MYACTIRSAPDSGTHSHGLTKAFHRQMASFDRVPNSWWVHLWCLSRFCPTARVPLDQLIGGWTVNYHARWSELHSWYH